MNGQKNERELSVKTEFKFVIFQRALTKTDVCKARYQGHI